MNTASKICRRDNWDSTIATLIDIQKMQKNLRLIKKSNERLIISGRHFEHRLYEKPYFFNFPPSGEERLHSLRSDTSTVRRGDSIWRSRQRIIQLVNSNENMYGQKMKFITYTFKNNVTDLKEARLWWEMYVRKLRGQFGKLRYLGVAEIQKKRYATTGHKVWHFHVLFFNLPFVYGAKDIHSRLWEQGFVKIITIDHVKNVGLYVSKYLRKDLQEEGLAGEKSFFTSKNLKKPVQLRRFKSIKEILHSKGSVVSLESSYQSANYGKIIIKSGTINL